MTVMQRLKEETREDHARTEKTELARSMVSGGFTRAHYRAQLTAYLEIHRALEVRMNASVDPAVAFVRAPHLEKSILIDEDLTGLRRNGGAIEITRLAEPLVSVLALAGDIAHQDGAALLGSIYVMEGSGLGSLFLLPRLRQTLDLRPDECRYYAGHGPKTMDVWRAFGGRMNEALVATEHQDEAVRSAVAMFRSVGDVFTEIHAGLSSAQGTLFPLHGAI